MIESPSPQKRFAAVFEDDGETGYFYAVDTQSDAGAIQDGLHIYDVADIADKTTPMVVSIAWSSDGQQAGLFIGRYPHAVFDFSQRKGHCRTGFPPVRSDSDWSQGGHEWDDQALRLFDAGTIGM